MDITIVGRGQVVCVICDPAAKKKPKAGVAIELDDKVQRVCNKHLQSVINMHTDPLDDLEQV